MSDFTVNCDCPGFLAPFWGVFGGNLGTVRPLIAERPKLLVKLAPQVILELTTLRSTAALETISPIFTDSHGCR